MANKLSDEEISRRLIRLRNLEQMYAHARAQIVDLQAENKILKQDNLALRECLSTLQIQLAELQTMVFGRHRQPPSGLASPVVPPAVPPPPRTPESYRRPIPPAAAITSELEVPLPDTCKCGGAFTSVTTHDRYLEDIPLPELTPNYQPHIVTRYRVQRGICLSCNRATSSRDMGGAVVALGPNVRLLVCHLVSVVGLSYSQITSLLASLYGLKVASGELARILSTTHQAWLPAYEQLKADIRGAPVVHLDETPWPQAAAEGRGYAWVMSEAGGPQVVFTLAQSRGLVHAQKLLGPDFTGIRVSDNYPVYRALPGQQQLCWAHLYRVIRDLRYNEQVPDDQLAYVTRWYEEFASIYQGLRTALATAFDLRTRQRQATGLWVRLRALLGRTETEPAKLTQLKAQIKRAGKDRLFTCLPADTPCDNNRAERDLRPLVLKRKRSFGSKTEQGAVTLSTIMSLCTTTWREEPERYFGALAELGV